jgi:hypothetical protein
MNPATAAAKAGTLPFPLETSVLPGAGVSVKSCFGRRIAWHSRPWPGALAAETRRTQRQNQKRGP